MNRGVFGTVRFVVRRAFRACNPLDSLARLREREIDREFDIAWGGDTAGVLLPDKEDVKGQNWGSGNRYQAMNAAAFMKIVCDLDIEYGEFTFLDYGSGKGRAVLLASRFHFRHVIGVEYAEEFHQIALQNLKLWPQKWNKCGGIHFVCEDAARYRLPKEPLVVFLYNPFGTEIMREVIGNLSESLENDPRPMIVIYFRPDYTDLWDSSRYFKRLNQSEWCAVYGSTPEMP